MKSRDGRLPSSPVHTTRSVYETGTSGGQVRCVPWTCPYPPEQVPQVGEEIKSKLGSVGVVDGVPRVNSIDNWVLPIRWPNHTLGSIHVTDVLKLPAPTITLPNGKKYDEAAVMERCQGLEEV